jgi:hypothetical protein
MPTPKLSVVDFLDHGVVAATATARTPDDDTFIKPAAPAPGETMTRVMSAAKNLKVTKADSLKANIDLSILIRAAASGIELATALINARYSALGGATGFLGIAQNAITACPDGVGYYQHFSGGSIYWSPATGAHEVHGLIRQRWANLGWERSFLGYPRTDETTGKDPKGEGRFNHFQGGSIYYHPQSGTFEVHGAILGKYLELGAEDSVLGYPTTDETATPDRVGRYNHFQRGSIYWTPATAAHEVHGLIRNYWAEKGWERNAALGYPLTDELVPHRSIGFTPAPWIVKPIGLPVDILKLPKEEPAPHLSVVSVTETTATPLSKTAAAKTLSTSPATVRTSTVKLASTASTTRLLATSAAAAKPASSTGTVSAVSTVKVGTSAELIARPTLILDPSIYINEHKGRSDDRFADFENGVVFWQRRTNRVMELTPRTKTPSGTKCAFTAAEITALAGARIRTALGTLPQASLSGPSFAGTTSYWFDGAGLHNRAHRLRFTVSGKHTLLGLPLTATFECKAEVAFDPVDREIVGYLTGWSVVSSPGIFVGLGNLASALNTRLSSALWKQFSITKLPATAADPIAILSVKTQSDGRVSVYFEP